ncbi:carboxypeptidase regulatory-like domain-containing protein [Cryobacterium sp. 1639]|uniref:MSCRAMM family protein n=1 Tax=Cryobacterium inferilacus TaxID=2866629 RepID=UPI001C73DC02|nr:carboxypeptidase regulatory-like domain-containing protein [Cryobacterium sp. 1639]MBX0301739.1 carboxypeptidase regulatory-like domain-containing protein [Cryobacterium sp. 1639]
MAHRSPLRTARTRLASRAVVGLAGLVGVLLIAVPAVIATHSAFAVTPGTVTPDPTEPPVDAPLPTSTATEAPAPAETTAPEPEEPTTPAPTAPATDAPTSAPTPTATPEPTGTPTPSATPKPEPTPTKTPTPTPTATSTPTPTNTQPSTGPINATSLTGRVTDQATGNPLAGVTVYIFTAAGGYGTAIPVTTTDSDGNYTFYSLDVRSYTLQFVATGHRSEWWGGHDEQATADTFPVARGEAVTGIDASLLPLDSISGTITGSPREPLAGATVSAYDTDGTLAGEATTTDDGGYAIAGLTPGRYTLRITAPADGAFVSQWLHDKTHPTAAALIELEADTPVTGKNVALAAGATLTGRVTDTTSGAGIQGAWVYAYAASTSSAELGQFGGSIASAPTNANGDYTLTGLAAGRYTLQFSGGSVYGSDGFLREWWGNKPSRANAVAFTLKAGQTIPNTDAALIPTATITGTVYAAGARNVGLNLATVSAIDSKGRLARSVTTNGDGDYTLTGLKPGKYTLRFSAPEGTSYGTTWWQDPAKSKGHGVIRVTAGEVVTGKTAELATGALDD